MSLKLVEDLRTRAKIRREIPNRKSVQNNEPDRIADQLDQAANALEKYHNALEEIKKLTCPIGYDIGYPTVFEFVKQLLEEIE